MLSESENPSLVLKTQKSTVNYDCYWKITSYTMLSLQGHLFMDLYCIVDDLVKEESRDKGGRPPLMNKKELVTVLIWNVCALR